MKSKSNPDFTKKEQSATAKPPRGLRSKVSNKNTGVVFREAPSHKFNFCKDTWKKLEKSIE